MQLCNKKTVIIKKKQQARGKRFVSLNTGNHHDQNRLTFNPSARSRSAFAGVFLFCFCFGFFKKHLYSVNLMEL